MKLQMILQMEPQMTTTSTYYREPPDRPTNLFSHHDTKDSPPEEASTAEPLLCPSQQEVARIIVAQLPNSTWAFLLRGETEGLSG